MKKYAALFFVMGWLYIGVEVAMRALVGDPVTDGTWKTASLCGWSSLWMFFVGGLASFSVGWLDENRGFAKTPMLFQAVYGGIIVTMIEFMSGLFFNKLLGLGLWDYSHFPFNLIGQVSLLTSVAWVAMVPLCLWLDNIMRFYMYGEDRPDSLLSYYRRLVTLK